MRSQMPIRRLLPAAASLISIALSTGCGGGNGNSAAAGTPEPPPTMPPTSSPGPWQGGYFAGAVTDTDGSWYAEALIATDGQVRIMIDRPERVQFVGSVREEDPGFLVGEGRLLGEVCYGRLPEPWCTGGASVQISIEEFSERSFGGSLRFAASVGDEVWTMTMDWPTDTYSSPASMQLITGAYWETFADFAHEGDVIISVDGGGRIFFQSAHSGCVGNGQLTPHGDGSLDVFDVKLLIEGCDDMYAPLNSQLEGLATRSIGDWDWGDWLVLWLSPEQGLPQTVAVTMWGARQ